MNKYVRCDWLALRLVQGILHLRLDRRICLEATTVEMKIRPSVREHRRMDGLLLMLSKILLAQTAVNNGTVVGVLDYLSSLILCGLTGPAFTATIRDPDN